jgi:hypothetical protein
VDAVAKFPANENASVICLPLSSVPEMGLPVQPVDATPYIRLI